MTFWERASLIQLPISQDGLNDHPVDHIRRQQGRSHGVSI